MSFRDFLLEKISYGPNYIHMEPISSVQQSKIKKINKEYKLELKKMGTDITSNDAKWLWDNKYSNRFSDIID